MRTNQPYKMSMVMHHGGSMKDHKTNLNWMTLEILDILEII